MISKPNVIVGWVIDFQRWYETLKHIHSPWVLLVWKHYADAIPQAAKLCGFFRLKGIKKLWELQVRRLCNSWSWWHYFIMSVLSSMYLDSKRKMFGKPFGRMTDTPIITPSRATQWADYTSANASAC
jgi:hypothetical protein